MKWLRRIILLFFIVGAAGLFSVYLINRHVRRVAAARLQSSMTEIPVENPPRIAIVFGAGVWENGEPSPALYDRIVTAAELYRAGRVGKILMSGDNPSENYDEPTVMRETAVRLGVPESAVVLDFAGRRTFDTCERAAKIFEVRRAILVTQEFHLARALYLCANAGIDSFGITADRRAYPSSRYWSLREFFSTASAWFEVNFVSFEAIGGDKEPIAQ